jgi:hypothetical protein
MAHIAIDGQSGRSAMSQVHVVRTTTGGFTVNSI